MKGKRRIVASIVSAFVVSIMSFSMLAISAGAVDEGKSLDDVINGNNASVSQDAGTVSGENANTGGNEAGEAQGGDDYNGADLGGIGASFGEPNGGSISEELKGATDLDQTHSGATKINQGIKTVASFIIQILSYALTVLLTLRVILDLIYINISFSRGLLGGGAQPMPGQPGQPGMGGGMGMGGMGSMGGMGMGGMGMGGMHSRYGGMGGMGGMGMGGMAGGMGMNGQQGMQQPGGGLRFVSDAAIMAVSQPSPMRYYAKDMAVTLIIVPILLILAVTGVLTDLGFLIGEAIAKMIGSFGGMA